MERRRFLTVVGAASLAGCLGGRTFEHAEDPWGDQTTETGANGSSLSSTVSLDAGQYAAWSYKPTLAYRFGYQIEVTDGGPIDMIFIEESEYDRFRDQEEFQYYTKLSKLSVMNAEAISRVQPGDYRLIFDNTHMGEATGEEPLEAEFTLATGV